MKAEAHTTLAFCAFFGALGAQLPFWPLWLAEWGLSEAEVGFYLAAGMTVRIAAGFVLPIAADWFDARRMVAAAATAVSALLFFAHAWTESRAVLFALTLVATGALLGAMPILETLGAIAAKRRGFDFARARGIGSAAFLGASLGVGWLVSSLGIDVVRWWVTGLLLIGAALMLRHPGGGVPLDRPGLGDILRLFSNRPVLLMAAAVATAQSSHGVMYAYGSIHWSALGYSEAAIGWLWAFAVICEVVLMVLWGQRLVRWLTPERALMVAAVVGVCRWTAMCFDPGWTLLLVLQGSHAVTFAIAHLALMAWVTERLDERMAGSAIALSGALMGGVTTAGVMFAAAAVYPSWGGATFALAAVLSAMACGFCAAVLLGQRHAAEPFSSEPH